MTTYKFIFAFLLTNMLSNAQTVNTVIGTGTSGFSGDGSAATAAQINGPLGISFDLSGNMYIADEFNNRIRKVNTSGVISTIAGTGAAAFGGDGGAATSAKIYQPYGLTVDVLGNIYIADTWNNRIRKINTSGIISTIAGTGATGYSGDGGPAINAQLNLPSGVAVDASGNVYIADWFNQCIRKINPSGTITTYAGTSVAGFSGDGGIAASAQLNFPRGISLDASGNIYIADSGNNRIRMINSSGVISTIAGTGAGGYGGDGGVATAAILNYPVAVAVDAAGNVVFGDQFNQRVRKINPSGIITTIAGTGTAGYSGDGGNATSAKLNNPYGIGVDALCNVYFADYSNHRVREIAVGSCATNINSLSNNNATLVYPNPNNGKFQIDTEILDGKIILINSLGQKVYEQKLSQGANNINADKLSKGLYHYVLLQNDVSTKSGNVTLE